MTTEQLRVTPGTLMAAWPDLRDPNFMHSVVVMCEHNAGGAHGFVVNRRCELVLRDLLPGHPNLGRSDLPVHVGGPVEPRGMQFLHLAPDRIPGGVSLDGELWIGGDLDALGRYVASSPEEALSSVRIFLGYSGWGPGQLDLELKTGSWVPAGPSKEIVFGEIGEAPWRKVVRSIGREGELLENEPPDVSWN